MVSKLGPEGGCVKVQALAFDVLIIGCGGAGLRAALAARETLPSDRRVAIAAKGKLGRTRVTATACSDRRAFRDALPYTPPDGEADSETVLLKALEQVDITVIEDCMLLDLIVENGFCRGALCLVGELGEIPTVIAAGAVVLATGGAGAAYLHSMSSMDETGDGYAAAWRAGAELVNMEFVQIGLRSVKTQLACSGSIMRCIPRFLNSRTEEFLPRYFPSSYTLMDIHAAVFRKGSTWSVSREQDTHLIDVAVYKETQGVGPVYLDFSLNPNGFDFSALPLAVRRSYYQEIEDEISSDARRLSPAQRLQELAPDLVTWLRDNGIDILAGDRIEVVPAVHYFQGGVRINESGAAKVPGLFAAGEAAGWLYGINGPGTLLPDTKGFGHLAGKAAASYALSLKPEVELLDLSGMVAKWHLIPQETSKATRSVEEIRHQIQQIMYQEAALVRTEDGLRNALEKIRELRDCLAGPDDSGLVYWAETVNMADVSEAVLTSALLRDESRGPHLRFVDSHEIVAIPSDEVRWQKYIVLTLKNGEIEAEIRTPVRPADDAERC